jgi:hypothetical protein
MHILAAVEKKITESFLRLQEAHHLMNRFKTMQGWEIISLEDLCPRTPGLVESACELPAEPECKE